MQQSVKAAANRYIVSSKFNGTAITGKNVKYVESAIAFFVHKKIFAELMAEDEKDSHTHYEMSILAQAHLRSVVAKNFISTEGNGRAPNGWKTHSKMFDVTVTLGYPDQSGTNAEHVATVVGVLKRMIGKGNGPIEVGRGPGKMTTLYICSDFTDVKGSGISEVFD